MCTGPWVRELASRWCHCSAAWLLEDEERPTGFRNISMFSYSSGRKGHVSHRHSAILMQVLPVFRRKPPQLRLPPCEPSATSGECEAERGPQHSGSQTGRAWDWRAAWVPSDLQTKGSSRRPSAIHHRTATTRGPELRKKPRAVPLFKTHLHSSAF